VHPDMTPAALPHATGDGNAGSYASATPSSAPRVFEQLLTKHKIERRIVVSTAHFMSIPFIIASTDLLVTLPYAVGESFAQIASIHLIQPPLEIPQFHLKQHWHRKFDKDEPNVWIRTIVAKLFGGSGSRRPSPSS
jgi:hypothetical protein